MVYKQIWTKIKALQSDGKEWLQPLNKKIADLEQEIDLIREPIMLEGRNLIQQNQAMHREIQRMQDVQRDNINSLMAKLEEQFDKMQKQCS